MFGKTPKIKVLSFGNTKRIRSMSLNVVRANIDSRKQYASN